MKNLFLILLVIFLASGCRSTKTVSESFVSSEKTTETKKSVIAEALISIDTTKVSVYELKYTKTEYYKPTSTASLSGGTPVPELVEGKLPAIKSVETITVRKKTEAKGKTETFASEKTDSNSLTSESTDTKTETEEKPTPDPRRWMWIFGILVLLTGMVVYLRNSPVVIWLKSVLSKAGKFLKI